MHVYALFYYKECRWGNLLERARGHDTEGGHACGAFLLDILEKKRSQEGKGKGVKSKRRKATICTFIARNVVGETF